MVDVFDKVDAVGVKTDDWCTQAGKAEDDGVDGGSRR